jgi:Tol biopolymer transport system component
MRLRTKLLAVLAASALVATITIHGAQKTDSAKVMLEAAKKKELVDGDLKAAIQQYRAIVDKFKNDRAIAAAALIHMADCYQRLGDAEARKIFEQVAKNYADQPEIAASARQRLAALEGVRTTDTLTLRQLFTTEPFARPESISPDGTVMGIDGGNIGVRDVASGQIRWLVDGGSQNVEAECPVISPDRRQVAYGWYPHRNGVLYGELRVISNEAGSKPRVLIPGNPEIDYADPLAWSPDAKSILIKIARRDQTEQIGWVSVSDGSIRVLKSLGWRLRGTPSLSPDGKYVAYSALPANPATLPQGWWFTSLEKPTRVYVLGSDGSAESELANTEGTNAFPIWSPDGAHLLFFSDRHGHLDLWSVSVQAGKAAAAASVVKRDVEGIMPIGMTRSGSYYYRRAIGRDEIHIVQMEPGGGKMRESIPRVADKLIGGAPAWSPDGKSIAFLRERPAGVGKTEFVTVVHSFTTGEEKTYTVPGVLVAAPVRWLHDSTGFLETIRSQNGTDSLYRVDVNSGEFKPVFTFSPSPDHGTIGQLAPDDKSLYVAGSDGKSIRAIDLTSGQQKRVIEMSRNLAGFALSPDGQALALATHALPGNSGYEATDSLVVARVSVDGSGYREIYTAQPVSPLGSLAWSKDGAGILVSWKVTPADGPAQARKLMRIPESGGEPEFTGLEQKTSGFIGGWINLNPDGTRLAFTNPVNRGVEEVWALDNVMAFLKKK